MSAGATAADDDRPLDPGGAVGGGAVIAPRSSLAASRWARLRCLDRQARDAAVVPDEGDCDGDKVSDLAVASIARVIWFVPIRGRRGCVARRAATRACG